MKQIILSTFFLIFTVSFTSCSSDDNKTEVKQNQSKFVGAWSGTYSGQSSGTWTAIIDANGEFTGQASSPLASTVFTMKGSVNNSGVLEADFYVNNSVVGEFNGTLNTISGQGTWTNTMANISGNWQGTKN